MSTTTKWVLISGAVLLVLVFLMQQKQTQVTTTNYGGAAGWLTGIGNLLTAGSKAYTNIAKPGDTGSYSPDIVYGNDSSIGGAVN